MSNNRYHHTLNMGDSIETLCNNFIQECLAIISGTHGTLFLKGEDNAYVQKACHGGNQIFTIDTQDKFIATLLNHGFPVNYRDSNCLQKKYFR